MGEIGGVPVSDGDKCPRCVEGKLEVIHKKEVSVLRCSWCGSEAEITEPKGNSYQVAPTQARL